MGGTCLNRLAVLNHRLDAIGAHRTGEALALALLTANHRDRQPVTGECLVDAEHLDGFVDRLGLCLVGRVAFLPQKLGCAKEESWTQFPANDIRPLI